MSHVRRVESDAGSSLVSQDHALDAICLHVQSIYESLYGNIWRVESFQPFFVEQAQAEMERSCVLFQQHPEDIFLGLQFPKSVAAGAMCGELTPLSVVAEEVSHFLALGQASEMSGKTSLLELEILGEIDKFCSLLFWFYHQKHSPEISSCIDEIFNLQFASRHFHNNMEEEVQERYLHAEIKAKKHLRALLGTSRKKLFSWNCFVKANSSELKGLRAELLGLRFPNAG
jgi:hypothetical protein